MKLFKKAAAFLIAAIVSVGCAATAFAEGGSGSPVGAELFVDGEVPGQTDSGQANTEQTDTGQSDFEDIPGMFPDISDKSFEEPDWYDLEQWDGYSGFEENTDYYINGLVRVTGNDEFRLPAGSRLFLKDGAQLVVSVGGEFKIGGELIVSPNSALTVSGNVSLLKEGRVENYGTAVFTGSSIVDISAQFINYSGSKLTFSGNIFVYKDGEFVNYSAATLSPDSVVKSTGIWQCAEGSSMFVKGDMTITLSGKTDLAGHIIVSGTLSNSGMLVFEESIKLYVEQDAKLILTKSGRLIDQREPDTPDTTEEFRAGVKGIDVSVWQGVIDWKKVKESGVKFAIIRSSVGDRVDTMFDYNITEASNAGINVGVYHYCYAMTVDEARAEARHFIETIKPYEVNYPVMFDFEDNTQIKLGKEQLTEIAEVFLSELKNAGYYPMIYSYKNWLENLLDMDKLSEYEVAVAEWDVPLTTYNGPYGIWQYSCKGKISGIEGDVDLDICYKDYAKIIREGGYNNLKS